MTDTALQSPPTAPAAPPRTLVFVLTVFVSAGLVFMVEPMVAKLVLPLLGGSPAVWNASLAFFQSALLLGYGYAHFLQKLPTVRAQLILHGVLLVLAGLALPLHVTHLLGDPDSHRPILWLLGVLAVSIGAPFAILSSTAPLVQAWYARVFQGEGAKEPYALYAASNLGSLLALIAYPVVIEPILTLHVQRLSWSIGYAIFVLVIGALALTVWRHAKDGPLPAPAAVPDVPGAGPGSNVTWLDRLVWVLLAAVPSSLMLGVTTYITTDVGSAPFLWVGPLALYLLTFVIAFQDKPVFKREHVLVFQAAMLVACVAILPFTIGNFVAELLIQMGGFFLTALVCHQALVQRRPNAEHLTEFYLWMSFGGVVGGSFNAFLAPVIFNQVIEYPLILVLSILARPWGGGTMKPWQWAALVGSVVCAVGSVWMLTDTVWDAWWRVFGAPISDIYVKIPLAIATVLAFLVRGRAFAMFGAVLVLCVSTSLVGDRVDAVGHWRSFFGVLRESRLDVSGLGGDVRMLANGTTLHGAQAQDPRFRCQPLVYYGLETPIGQVFQELQGRGPVSVGAVGLGTGSVAAYVRPQDRLTFYEIDPLVVKVSGTPKAAGGVFTYTTECAKGPINYVIGDARLTLNRQPNAQYDILLIDAFSSDAVPAHLLTVEAIKMYLAKLKPGGILILHLSNRNLNLRGPAISGAIAAGGFPLLQLHTADDRLPPMWESDEHAVIVARTAADLEAFRRNPQWETADAKGARPWTDDYTNLFGALLARLQDQWSGTW
ncbi:MAG: fused MFS/spermidine synthase [Caulobacteraceae bacterium]